MRRPSSHATRCALVLLAGCGQQLGPAPAITGVSPKSASDAQEVTLTISGDHFQSRLQVDFDTPAESSVVSTFTGDLWASPATLLPFSEVSLTDGSTLSATLPSGSPPGLYGVAIVDPWGRTASLAQALTITGGVSPFPYAPSNFNPGMIPTIGNSLTVGCTVQFDSSPNAQNSNWCGQPIPPMTVVSEPSGPDVVVLSISGFTVTPNGSLTLVGSRPVILAVFGSATVHGSISASSQGSAPGAGGSWSGCGSGAGTPGSAGRLCSGGGGGGFLGSGGVGGDGDNSGGSAGIANGSPALIPLRGGCSGGTGGSNTMMNASAGGAGGGAVQISVAGSLTVDSRISAEGGGGGGARPGDTAAGGGGGSGGAIVMEANDLRLNPGAAITANGGGGGGGAQTGNGGTSGNNGSMSSAVPAPGGMDMGGSMGAGGSGGAGATASTPGAAGGGAGAKTTGAGGGGGGTGRIRFNAASSCSINGGAVLSPTPTSTQTNCE
jgi:hypothetical protein